MNLIHALEDAGLPPGVVNFVMGPGDTVGDELQSNPGIDGIVFTGSYDVGMKLFKTFSTAWPRPCIVEMGGKNPAIVSRKADLEEAAEGIMRSAFGFGGQKCSANSRVYVEKAGPRRPRPDARREDREALDRRPDRARELARPDHRPEGGRPAPAGRLRGPPRRQGLHRRRAPLGRRPRARLLRRADGRRRPAADHRVFRDELFAPFTSIQPVESLDEALALANDTIYGLTAGVYSEDPSEVERFLDEIQAGVLYVNRRAGATTGAWPGVQAFGGWKGSGSTGKAGLSMYYVAQFLREQSHTVVD